MSVRRSLSGCPPLDASLLRRRPPALVAALLALFMSVTATLHAQPTALPGDDTKATKLKLAEKRGQPGLWARATARLDGDKEKRYFAAGLKVSAPLSIQVIAERTDTPVRVQLFRTTWARPETEGSTGRDGLYRFEGRAFGSVGIRLLSETGERTRATVLVWQGNAVPPSFATVYAAPGSPRAAQADARPTDAPAAANTPPSTAGANDDSGFKFALIAVLVVIAGLLGVLVVRRGKGTAAAVLVGAGLLSATAGLSATPAWAAKEGADIDISGEKPPRFEPPADKDKDKDKPPPDPDKDRDRPPVADKDKDKDAPSDDKNTPEPDPDDGGESAEAAPDSGDVAGDYRDRLAAAEASVRELAERTERNRAEIERLKFLLESDRDNEPDPANLPPMPLSCQPPRTPGGDGVLTPTQSEALDDAWERFEECRQCYVEPLAEFERQLLLYEQLRVLYSDAKKYLDKVILVGDSAAKPHYLLENAWAKMKLNLKIEFAKTQTAYDSKLVDFNGRLSATLDRIGECETTVNNNPMWRRTSGLFFEKTMATSYKRTD